MDIVVSKLDQTEFSTVSKMFIEGEFIGFVIEDGEHASKIYGSTRIDAGRYPMTKDRSTRFTYTYGYAWWIRGTPRHTEIKIHKGNRIEHTNGCLLPNAQVGFDGTNYYGINSKAAYDKMMSILQHDEEHTIFIVR